MQNDRVSWEEYALNIAHAASERSEDPFMQVGACALNHQNMVLGVGYNGLASGKDIDWEKFDRDGRRQFMIHAETNCLSLCKKNEPKLLAVTLLPCSYCATMIAAYGVEKVVFGEIYERDTKAVEIFDFYKIELIQIGKNEGGDLRMGLNETKPVIIPDNGSFTIS